jgi:hypothetical protein
MNMRTRKINTGHDYFAYEHSEACPKRTMFDLISSNGNAFGAKQILLSVCDGYFVKHPTKTYLK